MPLHLCVYLISLLPGSQHQIRIISHVAIHKDNSGHNKAELMSQKNMFEIHIAQIPRFVPRNKKRKVTVEFGLVVVVVQLKFWTCEI
jgi:hypothetical protein